MLSKEEHEIVKQAAKLLKREMADVIPDSPEDKPGKVSVYKFGSFIVKKAKPREVTNPAIMGGKVQIPERVTVRFSASKIWLAKLNG